MTFGLNALHGKHQVVPKVWEGAWDPTNAYDFIKYTVSKGYRIDAWELGNALYSNSSTHRRMVLLYLLFSLMFNLTLLLHTLL